MIAKNYVRIIVMFLSLNNYMFLELIVNIKYHICLI